MKDSGKYNGTVIIFPDFQKLQDEVDRLRIEFTMLVLERDELQFVVCRNIETEYMLKLGGLEYKVYEAQCTALRLKRKAELIQARRNRQEKVILSKIEETLDIEFSYYQRKLNEQIERMNNALERSKLEVLSDEETKELKRLYRKIVKSLHPDINPGVTGEQIKLLDNAVTAYRSGDLATLRIINEMVGDPTLPENHKDAMSQLVEDQERLTGLMKAVKDDIDRIKSEYPYSVKDIIESKDKTEQKKSELQSILSRYTEMIEAYKARIEEMLR